MNDAVAVCNVLKEFAQAQQKQQSRDVFSNFDQKNIMDRNILLNKSKEELVDIIEQISIERVAEKEKYGSARILVDQMFQMAALISLDDRILDANGPCLEGIGKTLDQVKGMPAYECQWWNFEEGPEVYKSLSRQCQATKKLARTECTLAAGDSGTTNIYVDCSMMPVLDENGEMTHMIGEARDITERKLAEDQVKQKTEELEQLYQKVKELDKMKSNFIANVSHELRTPLALICGPVDMLIEWHYNEGGDEESGKLLRTIQANSYVLLKHVNALLSISRLEAGNLHLNYEYLELDTLMERICSMFDVISEERRIKFERDLMPITIQADSEKFESILLNLLSNAFKFTQENGRIIVKTDITEQDSIHIDIADSGPGVPIQFREIIFQRFRQIDENATRTHGGVGLGLAIASELMKAHNGSITVLDSEYGGALFRITLPRYAPVDQHVSNVHSRTTSDPPNQKRNLQHHIGDAIKQTLFEVQETSDSTYRREVSKSLTNINITSNTMMEKENYRKPTVLVIEDNISMNNFICLLLQDDYFVISALDGEDGLDKIMKEQPDCVICDIMMPKISGDQLVAQVRKNLELNAMPIIILTAKIDSKIKVDLLRMGAQDCIAKPFEADDLLARVRNLVSMGNAWKALQRAHRQQHKNFKELIEDMTTLFNQGLGLEIGLFQFDGDN